MDARLLFRTILKEEPHGSRLLLFLSTLYGQLNE